MSKGNELIQIVRDYFAEARKLMPEVTDDMLCDEGDGEKIYYMNGNDGTDFDWQVNNRLCEFFMFYKENEYGFIKVFVQKDGTIVGYLYGDKGHADPVKLPVKNISKDDAKCFMNLMYQNADRQDKWDKPISQIDFE
jgi:hypothetical protein